MSDESVTNILRRIAAVERDALALVVPWLAGACLRLTILAVPPILPLLHADLGLSEVQVGLLSALPPLVFAIAAVPGAFLVARFGIRETLMTGLVMNAVASAARGAIHSVGFLYATTVFMGAGVSITQPVLPPLVRTRFPDRVGFPTAVYTNGLLVGGILAVPLTVPLVLPLVGIAHTAKPSSHRYPAARTPSISSRTRFCRIS
jgi:MFS transporter, CP family, cyanate transporter